MTPVVATPTFTITISSGGSPPPAGSGSVIPPTSPLVPPALAGSSEPVVAEPSFELRRRSNPNTPGPSLEGVVAQATIDLDNDRPIVRQARFLLRVTETEIDPANDMISIAWRLHFQGGVATFPMGSYLLDEPRRMFSPRGDGSIEEFWRVNAGDLTVLLLDARTSTAHTIPTGANYISGTNGVRAILDDIGVAHNIPDPGLSTPAYFTWAPETTALEIVNFMLEAVNFYPIWPDNSGTFISRERIDPESETAAVVYSGSTEPKMILPPFETQQVIGREPNQVVVLIDHPDRTPGFRLATNDDPTSPVSRIASGQLVNRLVDGAIVADTTVAQNAATFLVKEAATRAETAQLDTLIDPRREPHEFYRIDIPGVESSTLWRVKGWEVDLDVRKRMRHLLGRARPITVTT